MTIDCDRHGAQDLVHWHPRLRMSMCAKCLDEIIEKQSSIATSEVVRKFIEENT